MTEPMIEETEAEVEAFTDELSDEALDREHCARALTQQACRAPRILSRRAGN